MSHYHSFKGCRLLNVRIFSALCHLSQSHGVVWTKQGLWRHHGRFWDIDSRCLRTKSHRKFWKYDLMFIHFCICQKSVEGCLSVLSLISVSQFSLQHIERDHWHPDVHLEYIRVQQYLMMKKIITSCSHMLCSTKQWGREGGREERRNVKREKDKQRRGILISRYLLCGAVGPV